jgi:acyl-coenzyme A thioesterase PaaI-like protein
MIRGDNIICGTTTTGTGTLTLAATPVPPGGVDFDVFARATGVGFGNNAAVLASYTIIEFTDTTFATAKATEKGVGLLTLGASAGIANATLARTLVQSTAVALNSQPATQNISPATAYSIVTAANTLVFIGASVADIPAFSPFVVTSAVINGDTYIAPPTSATNSTVGASLVGGTFYYIPFTWLVPMLVKRAAVYNDQAFTGTSNSAWGRLYDVASGANAGYPGKLLYDFGVFGTAGSSFNSAAPITTGGGGLGSGYFMTGGDYFFCIAYTTNTETQAAKLHSFNNGSYLNVGRLGSLTTAGGQVVNQGNIVATGSPSATPDDPAVVASLTNNGNSGYQVAFRAT